MRGKSRRKVDYVLALLYVLILFGSAPFVPSLWRFLEGRFTGTDFLPQCLAALSLLILMRYLPHTPSRIITFLVLSGLFFYGMMRIHRPVERIHFLEYGALALFLFRAIRHHVKIPWSYGISILGAFGIGLLDEIFQGFLPNRFYDPRDLWMNLAGAGLGMAIFACVLPQQSV